jgi:hypothetical protein
LSWNFFDKYKVVYIVDQNPAGIIFSLPAFGVGSIILPRPQKTGFRASVAVIFRTFTNRKPTLKIYMRFLLFFVLLCTLELAAQPRQTLAGAITRPLVTPQSAYLPEPGASLNHTQIMFEYPAVENAALYRVVVEEIIANGKQEPTYNIVAEQTDRSTATLISNLKLGKNYRWRVIAFDEKGNSISKSQPLEFNTAVINWDDTQRNILRVTKNTTTDSGLVAIDFARSVYDRSGNIVWVVPAVENKIGRGDIVRDLKITPQGTFTFLADRNAFEVSVDGQILWSGPNNKALRKNSGTDYYHGNVIRTASGNYFTLGNEAIKTPVNGNDTILLNYPYIAEYNWMGQQTWMWSSRNYFRPEELIVNPGKGVTPYSKGFMSSISTDATGQYIYAGFRMLGIVLKIERITGKVIARYTGAFSNIHDVQFAGGDTLLVFNNNGDSLRNNGNSTVQLLQMKPGSNELITLWEFDLRRDAGAPRNANRYGNAELLASGHILIGGGSLARVLEVKPDKTIVWDAFCENWNPRSKRFEEFQHTRVHYTSSLYPCYFTVRQLVGNARFALTNEGSEDDTYTCTFQFTDRNTSKAASTSMQRVFVNAGNEEIISLPADVMQRASGTVEVKVVSVVNPQFVRKLVLRVN